LQVKLKLKHPNVKVPTYATDGSGCFDIYADLEQSEVLVRNLVLGTGLFFEIPKGKALMIYSRSGQGFNYNVRLANAVGVVDSDFRGELKIKLTNDSDNGMLIKPGVAIAQGMIVDAPQVNFEIVDELSDTIRGTGGFGSTDK